MAGQDRDFEQDAKAMLGAPRQESADVVIALPNLLQAF
jgi:hypothetical protein